MRLRSSFARPLSVCGCRTQHIMMVHTSSTTARKSYTRPKTFRLIKKQKLKTKNTHIHTNKRENVDIDIRLYTHQLNNTRAWRLKSEDRWWRWDERNGRIGRKRVRGDWLTFSGHRSCGADNIYTRSRFSIWCQALLLPRRRWVYNKIEIIFGRSVHHYTDFGILQN